MGVAVGMAKSVLRVIVSSAGHELGLTMRKKSVLAVSTIGNGKLIPHKSQGQFKTLSQPVLASSAMGSASTAGPYCSTQLG